MAVLLDDITTCVFQAFDFLQQEPHSGLVHKSKLKVLTANIGTLLDLYGVERGLEHFRSTSTLTFDQFRFYLKKEVFAALPSALTRAQLRDFEARIAEVCWLVCRKRFLERALFKPDCVFQLFRIFNVLAELQAQDGVYQALMHPQEVASIAQTLALSLGCPWDQEDFTSLTNSMPGSFRLVHFLAVLESRCLVGVLDSTAIAEAVHDLYQTIVEDVIKKGALFKKGYIFPTMREYWFVLRPSELTYYKTRAEKTCCGSLPIEPGSRVETKAGYKIVLHTPERAFELGTTDHMSRLQWSSALQLAVDYSGQQQTYQRMQASRRRMQRAGRVQEMLKARAQLQQEKNARQVAEGQAKELEAVVKEETRKLGELEELRTKLERLLEEETQAKRDEEIVRACQARVLAEEWEKREELERLQEEQISLLEQERRKRKEFEELQQEKEIELRNAETRLDQLEKERQALDEQLKMALDKIQHSENQKEVLETRLYQVGFREGERVRRAHSFMPSTRERPVLLEVRPATLRRPTKK